MSPHRVRPPPLALGPVADSSAPAGESVPLRAVSAHRAATARMLRSAVEGRPIADLEDAERMARQRQVQAMYRRADERRREVEREAVLVTRGSEWFVKEEARKQQIETRLKRLAAAEARAREREIQRGRFGTAGREDDRASTSSSALIDLSALSPTARASRTPLRIPSPARESQILRERRRPVRPDSAPGHYAPLPAFGALPADEAKPLDTMQRRFDRILQRALQRIPADAQEGLSKEEQVSLIVLQRLEDRIAGELHRQQTVMRIRRRRAEQSRVTTKVPDIAPPRSAALWATVLKEPVGGVQPADAVATSDALGPVASSEDGEDAAEALNPLWPIDPFREISISRNLRAALPPGVRRDILHSLQVVRDALSDPEAIRAAQLDPAARARRAAMVRLAKSLQARMTEETSPTASRRRRSPGSVRAAPSPEAVAARRREAMWGRVLGASDAMEERSASDEAGDRHATETVTPSDERGSSSSTAGDDVARLAALRALLAELERVGDEDRLRSGGERGEEGEEERGNVDDELYDPIGPADEDLGLEDD